LDLFQGLKIGVPSGCLGETSLFKTLMTDDRYFVVKAPNYMLSLLNFSNSVPDRRYSVEKSAEY